MRLLVFGDFHGSFQKVDESHFDAIISAGDFFGLSPRAYKESLALRMLYFKAHQTPDTRTRRTILHEYALRGKQFQRMVRAEEKDNFKRARRIMEYLNSFGKPVFVIPGNWECFPPFCGPSREYLKRMQRYHRLKQGLPNIVELHLRSYHFNGAAFIGIGLTQMPENVLYHDPALAEECYRGEKHLRLYKHWMRSMQPLFERARKRREKVIFTSHNQPYSTKLDLINNADSPAHGEHYGSCVTRKLIDEFQPVLCIGAHIHENRGMCTVGKTRCINPGFGGHGEYAIVELSGRKVRVQFKSNKVNKIGNKKKHSKRTKHLH